ncbi:hypothetical protein [Salinicoccus roseus]|uniref:hypothetical protein n=1 Tax=Salinicoccus roseus TaxID=45670 RepID=UPI002300FFF9|nr:hypothetical protein [Salinicoccus roseus]
MELDLEFVDDAVYEIKAIQNRLRKKNELDLSTTEMRELAVKLYMNEQANRRHNEYQGNLGTMYGGMMQ